MSTHELATAILATTETHVPMTMAVGRLQVINPTGTSVGITGINPGEPIIIARSSWSSVFIAQYATGDAASRLALHGRQVLVLNPAGQPLLMCTIGDS